MKRTSQTKCTITRTQYDTIKQILNESSCFAVAQNKVCKYLFGKQVTEINHAYMSSEWYTSQRLTRAVMYDYKYLQVV